MFFCAMFANFVLTMFLLRWLLPWLPNHFFLHLGKSLFAWNLIGFLQVDVDILSFPFSFSNLFYLFIYFFYFWCSMDLRLFPLYLCATIVERFKAIKFVSFLRSLGICERPIVPSRGPLILHGNNFLDGDEIQFSCVANYDLFGSQRSRCVGQKWNNRKPECKGRLFFSQLTLWAYFSAQTILWQPCCSYQAKKWKRVMKGKERM